MALSMQAVRIETTVGAHGEVRLTELPFHAGEVVEIIVLPRPAGSTAAIKFPLRGTPIEYHQPTEPVAVDDWEAIR
jgi:hypothetical protein